MTQVHITEIPEANGLDHIVVYWHDVAPGKGHVTIVCYGAAWTAYFGAMDGRTIRKFFAEAGVDYLVTKLGITEWLKSSRKHENYVTRIVSAIKAALGEEKAKRKSRIPIDPDLLEASAEYVQKQIAVITEHGTAPTLSAEDEEHLVYNCAVYPQECRNLQQKLGKKYPERV